MLKRLRIKFVALNMVLIAIVLTFVSVAICVMSHNANVRQVYSELDSALEQAARPDSLFGGAFGYYDDFGFVEGYDGLWGRPGDSFWFTEPSDEDEDSDLDDSYDSYSSDRYYGWSRDALRESRGEAGGETRGEARVPTIGGTLSSEAVPIAVYDVYESYYYYAVSQVSSATIDDETLEAAIAELSTVDSDKGLLEDIGLFYAKRGSGSDYLVAFADSSVVDSWHRMAILCASVEFVALLLFLIINWFFSKWALAPIEEAWRRQQQFVADASHELKTPLTVILANTSILLSHPEKTIAEESQWVESTQTEAKSMQTLVADMLELAQNQKDSDAFELGASRSARKAIAEGEIVDFSDLLEGELLQFESVAFERGVIIESELERSLNVRGDKDRLRRLVGTLIDNACKYSNSGGTVRVRLASTGKNLVLTVNNGGTPIDKDDLEHIFDRFYRTDKARNRSEGGYGLGLSIARDAVQEHGGTISADSSLEEGTTLTVTLPLA